MSPSSDKPTTSGSDESVEDRSGPRRPKSHGRTADRDPLPEAGPKDWGRVARRGAGRLDRNEEEPESGSDAWREAMEQARKDKERIEESGTHPDPDWEPEEWESVDLRDEASDAVGRGRSPDDAVPRERVDASDAAAEVPDLSAAQGKRLEKRLEAAGRSFEREYYAEALRILKSLVKQAPTSASVRELLGLTLYRMGRWKQAIAELEQFRALSSSTEQHPVLADCYRAVHRYDEVDDLWDELRQASPSAELVTEGRIVAAGAAADQGRLSDAIAMLGKNWRIPKQPRAYHLRRAYALADAYERAGDVPQARDLFERICRYDRQFADARKRARSLA